MNGSAGEKGPLDRAASCRPLLSAFLESSESVCVAVLDPRGGILYLNRAMEKLLGVGEGAATGAPVSRYCAEADAAAFPARLEGERGAGEEFLLNLVGADRSPKTVRCRLGKLADGHALVGEPAVSRDLALQEELIRLNNRLAVLSRENARKGRELAEALDTLKQAQTMLVHQEKMASLGQMTAGIAHEINNPIAFVLSNEHVLRRDFGDLFGFVDAVVGALPAIAASGLPAHAEIARKAEEAGLEYLAEAVPRKIAANIDGLERVKRIVLDLRNFSRLDEAERKRCDVAEGIGSTLRFLGPLLEKHGVAVRTDFRPSPPVLCAPGILNQAIGNVIGNAVQASAPGQEVRVAAGAEGDDFVIEVEDHGSGIAPEHLPKVFDPFFTTKPVGTGTGLGLSIAHQVVAAHNGTVRIDSAPGRGTVVRIRIPVDPEGGEKKGSTESEGKR
jgi:two-component system NtrC family sensor kinase